VTEGRPRAHTSGAISRDAHMSGWASAHRQGSGVAESTSILRKSSPFAGRRRKRIYGRVAEQPRGASSPLGATTRRPGCSMGDERGGALATGESFTPSPSAHGTRWRGESFVGVRSGSCVIGVPTSRFGAGQLDDTLPPPTGEGSNVKRRPTERKRGRALQRPRPLSFTDEDGTLAWVCPCVVDRVAEVDGRHLAQRSVKRGPLLTERPIHVDGV